MEKGDRRGGSHREAEALEAEEALATGGEGAARTFIAVHTHSHLPSSPVVHTGSSRSEGGTVSIQKKKKRRVRKSL